MMASRSASAAGDTEKVSVNVGFVDLGQIDLLVQEGFYSTRTDFIRTAIRNQLDRQDMSLKSSVQRHEFELGMKHVSRLHLESVLAKNELVDLRVIGLMKIADDVSVQLARKTIGSIRVLGALRINPQLRKALQDRIL
jgi:Arc/MetJ-type ribon-helix-helix transcriptional regulator